jgi:hypothetical protein
MKIEVNVEKKYFFGILAAVIILAGIIFGYAYGGSQPQVMGHSAGELDIILANGSTVNLQTAITNNWISGGAGGSTAPSFITPEILSHANINKTGAWKTWSLSGVPDSASAALVFGKWAIASSQTNVGMINVRKPSVGSTIPVVANSAKGTDDDVSTSGFAIVPVTNGDLEYQVVNYESGTLELQVYGYW